MKSLIHVLVGALILVVLFFVAGAVAVERIPAHETGVREDRWGDGIEAADFEPGLHLGISGKHAWHLFERGTRVLTFSEDPDGPPGLDVRTADNNSGVASASLSYRVIPGEYHLLVRDGYGRTWEERVASIAESLLRKQLSAMGAEEWFDTEARRARATSLKPLLNAELAPLHVEVRELLLIGVGFSKDYESKLQERQVIEQTERLEDARTQLVDAEGQREVYKGRTKAMLEKLTAERDGELTALRANQELELARIRAGYSVYDAETRAQADARRAELLAEGQGALEKAQAGRDLERFTALQSPGGRLWLACEMARNLEITRVTLNSNDPDVPSILDVDQLVRLLIGEED